MVDSTRLSELLKAIEATMAGSPAESPAQLIPNVMQTLELNASQLANALGVSPASVSRWISGGNSPQPRQLRTLHDLVRSLSARQTEPEGLEFRGRTLGIGNFDLFIKHASKAKTVYILKSGMGFQAGMNSAIRQQVRDLVAFNDQLKICYGYTRDSEAAMTFLNFRRELSGDWPRNIFWKEFDAEDEITKLLGAVFASPFIIENADGRIEILLECPVKILKTTNEFDSSSSVSMFVEIADTQKFQMWMQWRRHLEAVDWRSAPVVIKTVKLWSDALGEQRDAAFELGRSTNDGFDESSSFVVATIEDRTVGTLRLTNSENTSPITQWNKGKRSLPLGKGVVEFTRGAVLPNVRNLGIFKSMILRALRDSEQAGFLHAAILVDPKFSITSQLAKFGFANVGRSSTFHRVPDEEAICQLLVCNLKESRRLWDVVGQELEKAAKQSNVSVIFE